MSELKNIKKPKSNTQPGIEGYYTFQININDKLWEFDVKSILRFLYEEEAGNVGAVCEFDFVTQDASIISYLNEGNEVKVTIGGPSELSSERKLNVSNTYQKQELNVTIVKLEIKYDMYPYIQIYCSGVIGNYDYFIKHRTQIIKQKNSIDAIQEVLTTNGKFIKIDNKVSLISKDIQNWIQYSISDRDFISDIWLHSDFGNNVLLLGINSQGHFIIRDSKYLLNQLASKKYKYTFTNAGNKTDDLSKGSIQYNSILYSQSNSQMNATYTYNREKLIYDLENGTEELQNPDISSSWLSLNNKLNRKDSITKLSTHSGAINANVHANYHNSYNYNVGRLLSLSSSNIVLGFNGKFINDLQILDPVNVTVSQLDSDTLTSPYEGGGYIVSKITRCLMNKSFKTTVTCCRENINDLKGDLT